MHEVVGKRRCPVSEGQEQTAELQIDLLDVLKAALMSNYAFFVLLGSI